MSDKVQITIKNKVGEKYADLQTKIVTPSKETQIITADEGYYGLREVIVGAPVVDIDLLANEINSMKESITEGDATPEDIALGKIAYVNGEKIVGTYTPPTTLKKLLDRTKSCSYMFSRSEHLGDLTGYIAYEDTSNVIDMNNMFFRSGLTFLPPLNTENVSNMDEMFYGCRVKTVSYLNMVRAQYTRDMFYSTNIINLTLKNIKYSLQVGSSSWGHLLTLESLLGLCQECINVNTSKTLTVGTTNMNKLANVYVKLTNEPEEDETLPKLPMVQCESTDEGAMTISEYMKLKSWNLA